MIRWGFFAFVGLGGLKGLQGLFERLYDKSYGHARTAVCMGLGVELFRVGQALSLENVLNNQLINK